MTIEAVFFDLGGTLVRSLKWDDYVQAARRMASAVGAPIDPFVNSWLEKASGLGTGDYTYESLIERVCRELRTAVRREAVVMAAKTPFENTRKMLFSPRSDAMDVLTRLRTSGLKLGVISDCAFDVPEIWSETQFCKIMDFTSFSCEVGMNKANPLVFSAAAAKVGVPGENCVYVADGMRNELHNAASVGMHSVRFLVPEEIDGSPLREEWDGPAISSLSDLLKLDMF